jgi:hypothetical protein
MRAHVSFTQRLMPCGPYSYLTHAYAHLCVCVCSHVMPDAYEALDKSLQERGQLVGGSTLLLGIFVMVLIESMVSVWGDLYTVYIRYFWQGNHHIYGHIR